jgi:hypothetical protein
MNPRTHDPNRPRGGLRPGLAGWWTSLPEAERQRVPLALGILGLAGVLLAHALLTMPALALAEEHHARQRLRADQARQHSVQAAPRWAGKSAATLRREIDGLKGELAAQRVLLADLEPRFASLARMEPAHDLFEALTGLAEASDMDIEVLEQLGLTQEERKTPPSAGRLAALAKANPYQRPLVRLKARASYYGLMQFLDGLAALPHMVAPVWISIEVASDAVAGGRPRLQWLNVSMDLSL